MIRSCLHPDRRIFVSEKKLREAYAAFSDLKLVFLSEADAPTKSFRVPTADEVVMPQTVAELEAVKRATTEARRAKRAAAIGAQTIG